MRIENYITILLYLDKSEWVSCNDIVKEFGYSLSVVARVIRELKRYNFIETRPGKGGGIRLIKPFSAFIVNDIIPFIDDKHLFYQTLATEFCHFKLSLFVSERDFLIPSD